MQTCLMVNEVLGLLGFMPVLSFGCVVRLPHYGGIKQIIKGQTCYAKWRTCLVIKAGAPVPDQAAARKTS